MKKKTVITTEKFEVWVIPQASDVPATVAPAPRTDSSESEPGDELMPVPEEHSANNVPPTNED
jgi:hypothetical protein